MLPRFGIRKGWLKADPRLTYRLPREHLRAPNPFSDDELEAFPGHGRTSRTSRGSAPGFSAW